MPLDLSHYANKHRIIVDTSSLMATDAEPFFASALLPAMIQAGTRIVLPTGVIREVEKHLTKGDAPRREAAAQADRIISRFRSDGAASSHRGASPACCDETCRRSSAH